MSEQIQRWHVFAESETLLSQAQQKLVQAAQTAIQRRGRFDLVLAGGSTPRGLYQRLALSHAGDPDWHVWFGDERCLPAGHVDRNETMARQAWLDQADIPGDQIHGIPDAADPETAASSYSRLLAEVGEFDLVLLGIGEDGHTASLFPGQDIGLMPSAADAVPVYEAPKPPPERVSLSARRLSQAKNVVVLITGAAKADAVMRWRRGEDLPIAHVRPSAGVDILIDEAAMGVTR